MRERFDFFHMDALSSAVPMKVDRDLQLTLMGSSLGSSLYHLLGHEIGQGYERAKSRTKPPPPHTARLGLPEQVGPSPPPCSLHHPFARATPHPTERALDLVSDCGLSWHIRCLVK
jgi:hypothetical protein